VDSHLDRKGINLHRCILIIKEKVFMPIDKELLDILVCPKCKGEIVLEEEGTGLICPKCKLKYPIEDDIPIMLIDEAIRIDE
jgi:hypothetical protein